MVSSSDCTSDAHFLCSLNEWAITCFWLRTVSPRSYISSWQASHYLVESISSSNALAFPVENCLISPSIFALSGPFSSSRTLCVFFWNAFISITHHHCQLCCWLLHHNLLSLRTQPSLSLLQNYIVVADLTLVYCLCGLNLSYITPVSWKTLMCCHSVEWIA